MLYWILNVQISLFTSLLLSYVVHNLIYLFIWTEIISLQQILMLVRTECLFTFALDIRNFNLPIIQRINYAFLLFLYIVCALFRYTFTLISWMRNSF